MMMGKEYWETPLEIQERDQDILNSLSKLSISNSFELESDHVSPMGDCTSSSCPGPLRTIPSNFDLSIHQTQHRMNHLHSHASLLLSKTIHSIQSDISSIRDISSRIDEIYTNIDEESRMIMDEQSELLSSADRIAKGLGYFKEAKALSIRMNSNSGNVFNVLQDPEEFIHLLQRLDQSIEFISLHSSFKESFKYLHQFAHLHHLALVKVKSFLEQSLENIIFSNSNSNLDKPQQQIIELFATAKTLSSLLGYLEQQSRHSLKYKQILVECKQVYFNSRFANVSRQLQNSFKSVDASLSDLSRECTLQLIQTVTVETQLYHEYFPASVKDDDNDHLLFLEYINSICGYIYLFLRPLVIQETNLDVLCDLCDVLMHEIVNDKIKPRQDEVFNCILVPVQRIIQDVQERLVYISQVYIIRDLGNVSEHPDDSNELGWDPILEKTLFCLSKLYRCLETNAFNLVAQDFVSKCLDSLIYQSKKKSGQDSHLFLMYNITTLRTQILPFSLELLVTTNSSLDFSEMRNVFSNVLHGQVSLSNFISMSTPRVRHGSVNVFHRMEEYLHNCCQSYVNHVSTVLVGSILVFLTDGEKSGRESELGNVLEATKIQLEEEYERVLCRLDECLKDDEKTCVLIKQSVQSNLEHAMQELGQYIEGKYPSLDGFPHKVLLQQCQDLLLHE